METAKSPSTVLPSNNHSNILVLVDPDSDANVADVFRAENGTFFYNGVPLEFEIPKDYLVMSNMARNCVVAYVIIFIIGAFGNLSILISVGKELWQKPLVLRPRVKLLILNLAVADLLVTFVVIPIEIIWRITVQWYGGTFLCKICHFFKAFGLFSSSLVIICISLDRLLAIVFPLKVIDGTERVRNMLVGAWFLSLVCALPQVNAECSCSVLTVLRQIRKVYLPTFQYSSVFFCFE